MPSGRTHDRITLWILPWIVISSFLLTRSGELTLIVAASFLFSGLMFGPDLDIYSLQFKRWGLLRWLWLPYQKFLRHRSLFSHGLIIGTVIRIVYLLTCLLIIAIFIVAITQFIWGFDWNWQRVSRQGIELIHRQYLAETIAGFLGLEIGAISHSVSDWLNSAVKRRKRKKIYQPKSSTTRRKSSLKK